MEPRVVERLEPIVLVWTALCGACVGSFLNVAVYRLPRRCLSVLRPARSFCPRCHHAIRWYENVPLLSWLALRGRCSACGGKIHWRYPLVEATTLILFAWLGVRDLSGGRFVDPAACALFVLHAAFASALLVSSLIDFEFRILPDAIDVPGLLLAPLAALLLPDLLDA
ncbi:MAG: prepilin peptidase, partial [Planctomycetota bacterium]